MGLVAAKTEIHEIGHSLETGEADDDLTKNPGRLGEVYSGRPKDQTNEEVNEFTRWSLMASGWNDQLLMKPMHGTYFAFSIEEASTINEP
jgi:hypothetical protein